MKKTISLALFSLQVLVAKMAVGETDVYSARINSRQAPIPLQAAICDIIGTGFVTDVAESGDDRITRIEGVNYWVGDPGSNTLFIVSHTNPPVNANIPILFFANSYYLPDKGMSRSEIHFLMAFNNNEFRLEDRKRGQPVFYAGKRSWIPCMPENEAVISFASNLVAAAQTNHERTKYYEIIRDGHNANAQGSRIRFDAEMSFWDCRHWMDTNMMWRAWDDPQLADRLKTDVNNAYYSKARSFFPRPPQFE
jgi:hypothetical protein